MKKLIIALVSMICVLTLSGCHGKSSLDAFSMPEEFDTSRNYEIVFWAKNDTNKRQVETYQKAISDFESYYPNVKISVKYYTDYTRIYNDVITNIQTGTTPNVCIGYPDNTVTYMTGSNTVVNLDELIDDPKYGLGGSEVRFDSVSKDELIKKYFDECYIQDGHYMLPFVRSTEACYINKTFVEKLGYEVPDVLTWDFIFEISEKALEKNEDGTYKLNDQNVMIPFIYKSTDNMMIQMLKQLDAGYSTTEGEVLIFNDRTKDVLKQIAPYAKSYAFSTFKIDSYPGNFLNAGQSVFGIDSTAGATWMGTDAINSDIHESSIVEFETVVRMIPQYDPENPQMISQGPSICVFNKSDSQEVLASFLFAQFLLTDSVQFSYSQTEGYTPVTTRTVNSDSYQDYLSRRGEDNDMYYDVKIDATRILLDNIDNTFVTPVFNGSASLREAAGYMIEDVTKGIRRNSEINDSYLDDLFKRVNQLYRLDERNTTAGGKKDLGELPAMSKGILITLGVVWTGIIAYYLKNMKKEKKE